MNLTPHGFQAGGIRSGNLSLRQQRMTLSMLETLRTESTRVTMSLVRYNDDDPPTEQAIPRIGGKYIPLPNEFVYLRTHVINLSCQCTQTQSHKMSLIVHQQRHP